MIYSPIPQINFMTQVVENACGDLTYSLGELILLQNASNRSRVCHKIIHRINGRIKSAILKHNPQALIIKHSSNLITQDHSQAKIDLDATSNNKTNLESGRDLYEKQDQMHDKSFLVNHDKNFPINNELWSEHNFNYIKSQTSGSESYFISPYLEGVCNLERGGYEFSVSLALVEGQDVECFVVYLPVRNEFFWTSLDTCSFLQKRRIKPTDHYKDTNQLLIHEFNGKSFDTNWASMIFKLRLQKCLRVQNPNHLSGSLLYLSMGCIDALITDTLPSYLPAYVIAKQSSVTVKLLNNNCYLLGSAKVVKLINNVL